MMRKPLIIMLAVLLLAAGAAGGLYMRWYYSPRYSLHQMVLALKIKNMNKFFKYMDLQAVFNNFIEASSQDLEIPEDKVKDEWTRLGQRLGRKFARHFLPQLFKSFEKDIRKAAESYLLNLDNTQLLGLAAAITVAGIEVKGEEALVKIRDPKSKEEFRFRMQRDSDGAWRIVSVNYQDLKKFIKREFG
jgi:hypothetical protein